MIAVAAANFGSVNQVIESPAPVARQHIKTLGEAEARSLLRYHASVQNRAYFDVWGLTETGLGVALALTLFFATNGNRLVMALSIAMLGLAMILHWLIAPQLVTLSNLLDFAPPEEAAVERAKFAGFHKTYFVLEVVKLALGGVLALRLLTIRARRRSSSRQEVNAVNHANHSHVDR